MAIVARVPGPQRIFVVTTAVDDAELRHLRDDLGRDPVVVSAPTGEAKRIVLQLRLDPRVELSLAPTDTPPVERGDRLDALVRGYALADRFRDVVVVADPATSTLLLRSLAPGQVPGDGAVTVVGLPRGDRPVAVRRGLIGGVALAFVTGVADAWTPFLSLPLAVGLAGLVLLLLPAQRHLGRELLLAAGVAVLVVLAAVAGSARFPGAW